AAAGRVDVEDALAAGRHVEQFLDDVRLPVVHLADDRDLRHLDRLLLLLGHVNECKAGRRNGKGTPLWPRGSDLSSRATVRQVVLTTQLFLYVALTPAME